MKKIVIAPDSFKGCLGASDVAEACEKGIRKVFPDAEVISIPLADGGEGTAEAFLGPLAGKMVECQVHDPLGRPLTASYMLAQTHGVAVMECAASCGLPLLTPHERNPLLTSTFGFGEMIRDALRRGVRKLIVGLGGSSTNDGGMGMMTALGVKFLDAVGRQLDGCGANLRKVDAIDLTGLLPELHSAEFVIAGDVTNPLLGKEGATAVFSPQKGASPDMIRVLESGMKVYADKVAETVGFNAADTSGAGAAGGLGFAFLSFMPTEMKSGIGLLLDTVRFDGIISDADLIITGEGSCDRQTMMGKVVSGVVMRAKRKNIPVIAIAGRVADSDELVAYGLRAVFPIQPGPVSLSEALEPEFASANIERTVEQIMRAAAIRAN